MQRREKPLAIRSAVASRPVAERTFVAICLAFACLTLAHAIYMEYSIYFAEVTAKHGSLTQQEYYRLHNTIALSADHPLFRGLDYAPDQYRIGVEYLGRFAGNHLQIAKYYIVFSVFDFLCAMGVGWLSYGALVGSEFFICLDSGEQSLAVILLLGTMMYPFTWVVPWERPETLPSALYLVASLNVHGAERSHRWRLTMLAAATIWQSFVRTDVPLVLGAAVLVLGVTPYAKKLFGSRAVCMSYGVLIAAIALGIQAYLKMVLYPHAVYPPDTAAIQLGLNMSARRLATFGVAMLPWGMVVFLVRRYRVLLDASDVLATIASILYLPIWLVFGVLSEVRLFVPFLLAMTPTVAKVALLALRGKQDLPASRAVGGS